MKASLDAIIQREQAEYLTRLTTQSDSLLAEMEDYAAEHGVPIADREVAIFLEITARATGAQRVLEIGMAIGYSVIHLARGMGERGLIVTIEPDEQMIRTASDFIERAGLFDRVRIERGKALEVMPHLHKSFDLLYIDALKDEYKQYLDEGLSLLRAGGVIVVDNLLWGGKVAQGGDDRETVALREFNQYFVEHPQLRAQVLPVGDGLGYAVKKFV